MTGTASTGDVGPHPTPVVGRLGDQYGKRRKLIAGLAAMVVGALVSGFTSTLLRCSPAVPAVLRHGRDPRAPGSVGV
ncbi:hypothetical protein ACIBJF_45030 [Streptomyces sp. NPDC050743]|uniref:hypothetical protein n=1 Tax=Streptomyces sp. NPDC050743 TaxID=3365634 RepID=UPI003795E869